MNIPFSEMKTIHARSYQWQRIALVVFWIAFIIYIPIGLPVAVVCEFERLPVDQVY